MVHGCAFELNAVSSLLAFPGLYLYMVPSRFQQVIKDNAANDLERNLVDQVSSPAGFLRRVPSYGSEVDWMEPSLPLCNASVLKPFGSDRLYDAFHLLQTEPYVQVSGLFMLHIDRLSPFITETCLL